MRGARDIERFQAEIAPDAMFDMGDEIAGCEARDFGKEILRLAGFAARPHHAVTQNILLGHDGEIGRFETMFEAEHGHANGLGIELLRIGPILDRAHGIEAMIGEHAAKTFGRAFRPRGQQHALAAFLQRFHMGGGEFKNIHLALRAFGREVAARFAACFGGDFGFRGLKRRKRAHLMV